MKKITDENTGYLINKIIIFMPHKNVLISCKQGEQFTLYSTASRCLVLLLNNVGEVVNHQQLYENGWEKRGKEVTPNTLYQTISELRRQLRQAGLEGDIIKTLPRYGWRINQEDIMIEGYSPQRISTCATGMKQPLQKGVKGIHRYLPSLRKLKYFAATIAFIL